MEYLDCGCLCSGDVCAVPCSEHYVEPEDEDSSDEDEADDE